MKKFLVVVTTLAAGLAIGLVQAEEKEKGKGGKGGDPAQRAAAMLKQLDKDGDKKLSKEEFAAGPMAAKAKEKGGDGAVDKYFAARDKDKDGFLDEKELTAPPRAKGEGKGERKPKQ